MAALAGIKANILLSAGRVRQVAFDAGTLTWQSSWYIAKVAGQSRWPFTQGTGRGRYYCIGFRFKSRGRQWMLDISESFLIDECERKMKSRNVHP